MAGAPLARHSWDPLRSASACTMHFCWCSNCVEQWHICLSLCQVQCKNHSFEKMFTRNYRWGFKRSADCWSLLWTPALGTQREGTVCEDSSGLGHLSQALQAGDMEREVHGWGGLHPNSKVKGEAGRTKEQICSIWWKLQEEIPAAGGNAKKKNQSGIKRRRIPQLEWGNTWLDMKFRCLKSKREREHEHY